MSVYLDASVILAMLIEETATQAMVSFLAVNDEPLIVSEFAAAEVASGISRLVRMGALEVSDGQARLADFDAWRGSNTDDLDIQAPDARLASTFVRRFDLGLRAPDGLHAALCRRSGHVLVTLDRRLARAAEALGVRVLVPG